MNDPYVYSNGTLKNKFNINNYDELRKLEADICFINLIDIDGKFDNEKIDENLIKNIHKYIFSDIFIWAGEYRTVPIFKSERVLAGLSITYSDSKKIDTELKNRIMDLNKTNWPLDDLETLSILFARKIALLWRVHPFRDGNTRTILVFSYIFAKKNNFPFDTKLFISELNNVYKENKVMDSVRDRFVIASLDDKDYPEVQYLAKMFYNAIKKEKYKIK